MDFREYQGYASTTDQLPDTDGAGLIVALLGLAGEVGELLSEYKKHLRDGDAHRLFKERVAEELGDLLWYLSNVASKFQLDLNDIAESNLAKCRARWKKQTNRLPLNFDVEFPDTEQLPRKFEVEIVDEEDGDSIIMRASVNGVSLGDPLTDNAYANDGYRFHDVFHLAFAACLGWSPVTRSNLRRKRKSDPIVDEVEDGGRATAIEEGISALVFAYAKNHNLLEGVTALDYNLLRTVMSMASHLEVAKCTVGDWERAILMGFNIWRRVVKNNGGTVLVNLDERSISYRNG